MASRLDGRTERRQSNPVGHIRPTRHAGHGTTNPQVSAPRPDFATTLPCNPIGDRPRVHISLVRIVTRRTCDGLPACSPPSSSAISALDNPAVRALQSRTASWRSTKRRNSAPPRNAFSFTILDMREDEVTEAQIQQWTGEAEAGYDVEELKRRGRGRPGCGAEPMQVVAVRLTVDELAALDAVAGRATSAVPRRSAAHSPTLRREGPPERTQTRSQPRGCCASSRLATVDRATG